MIGLNLVISRKKTFAVKRIIFHIHPLVDSTAGNKKTKYCKDEEGFPVNQATQIAQIVTS